jgi:hypothetical protein
MNNARLTARRNVSAPPSSRPPHERPAQAASQLSKVVWNRRHLRTDDSHQLPSDIPGTIQFNYASQTGGHGVVRVCAIAVWLHGGDSRGVANEQYRLVMEERDRRAAVSGVVKPRGLEVIGRARQEW